MKIDDPLTPYNYDEQEEGERERENEEKEAEIDREVADGLKLA